MGPFRKPHHSPQSKIDMSTHPTLFAPPHKAKAFLDVTRVVIPQRLLCCCDVTSSGHERYIILVPVRSWYWYGILVPQAGGFTVRPGRTVVVSGCRDDVRCKTLEHHDGLSFAPTVHVQRRSSAQGPPAKRWTGYVYVPRKRWTKGMRSHTAKHLLQRIWFRKVRVCLLYVLWTLVSCVLSYVPKGALLRTCPMLLVNFGENSVGTEKKKQSLSPTDPWW